MAFQVITENNITERAICDSDAIAEALAPIPGINIVQVCDHAKYPSGQTWLSLFYLDGGQYIKQDPVYDNNGVHIDGTAVELSAPSVDPKLLDLPDICMHGKEMGAVPYVIDKYGSPDGGFRHYYNGVTIVFNQIDEPPLVEGAVAHVDGQTFISKKKMLGGFKWEELPRQA